MEPYGKREEDVKRIVETFVMKKEGSKDRMEDRYEYNDGQENDQQITPQITETVVIDEKTEEASQIMREVDLIEPTSNKNNEDGYDVNQERKDMEIDKVLQEGGQQQE